MTGILSQAMAAGVPRYFGVDSDAVWIGKARTDVPDNYRFYFADIGPTKSEPQP
jgi:hypothetical protein